MLRASHAAMHMHATRLTLPTGGTKGVLQALNEDPLASYQLEGLAMHTVTGLDAVDAHGSVLVPYSREGLPRYSL